MNKQYRLQLKKLAQFARELITECNKEDPCLSSIETVCKTSYKEILKKPFWRTSALIPKESARAQIKATHLALLALDFEIQEFFGKMVILTKSYSLPEHMHPLEKEVFALYNAIVALHVAQWSKEDQHKQSHDKK